MDLTSSLQSAAETIRTLSLAVFVPRCIACDQAMTTEPPGGLCEPCTASLESASHTAWRPCCTTCCEQLRTRGPICLRCTRDPPEFSILRSVYLYGGALAEALSQAKFRKREDAGERLGHLLAVAPETALSVQGIDVVVPVPLGFQRRWSRGYNQSALLARAVGRAHNLPVRYALRRVRQTVPQSGLLLEERQRNVSGAFWAKSVSGVILLVDDVATSCSTARAAASALKKAGAAEVRVLTLLRRG